MKRIELPCFDLKLFLNPDGETGDFTSNFAYDSFDGQVDLIFAFVLNAAISGIDVTDPKFVDAIQTTVYNILNQYQGRSQLHFTTFTD